MHFKTKKCLSTSFSFNKIRKKLIEDLYAVCKYFICFSPSLEEYLSLVVHLATKFKRHFFLHIGKGRIPNFLGISYSFNLIMLCFTVCWLFYTVLAVFLQYVWLFFLYLLIPWKEKLSFSQPKTSCWNGCQQSCGVKKKPNQTKTILQTGNGWTSGMSFNIPLNLPTWLLVSLLLKCKLCEY